MFYTEIISIFHSRMNAIFEHIFTMSSHYVHSVTAICYSMTMFRHLLAYVRTNLLFPRKIKRLTNMPKIIKLMFCPIAIVLFGEWLKVCKSGFYPAIVHFWSRSLIFWASGWFYTVLISVKSVIVIVIVMVQSSPVHSISRYTLLDLLDHQQITFISAVADVTSCKQNTTQL